MYAHVSDRIEKRDINLSDAEINYLCEKCVVDSAILIKREFYLGDRCYLILIVRNKRPITVMYRRCSQKMNLSSLNVDKIINLIN
jgi:hypothetical protein